MTAYELRISDCSADVCSSDLLAAITGDEVREVCHGTPYLQVEAGVASGCDSRYLAAMNEMTPLARTQRARKPDWIRVKAPTSAGFAETKRMKIGLGTCRERVCQYGSLWGVAVDLKKKK